jgi:hypothetical protein
LRDWFISHFPLNMQSRPGEAKTPRNSFLMREFSWRVCGRLGSVYRVSSGSCSWVPLGRSYWCRLPTTPTRCFDGWAGCEGLLISEPTWHYPLGVAWSKKDLIGPKARSQPLLMISSSVLQETLGNHYSRAWRTPRLVLRRIVSLCSPPCTASLFLKQIFKGWLSIPSRQIGPSEVFKMMILHNMSKASWIWRQVYTM